MSQTTDHSLKITDDHLVSQEKQRQTGFQTYKNILVISISFLFQFTAFNGIQNLQSSLNTEANIGVNSSSIIYVFLIVSSIFLPHPFMSIFGLKWSLVISQVSYVLFIAANYYPKAYLMYPTAVMVGISAAVLWTSKGCYLTDLGATYASQMHLDKNAVLNRFFGIFFTFFQSCMLFFAFTDAIHTNKIFSMVDYVGQIWGNMISYLVLAPENKVISTINVTNSSTLLLFETYDKCGADFSEHEYQNSQITNKINRRTIDILCIIYVCIGTCSIIISSMFLDQRRIECRDTFSVMFRNSLKLFISTVKHMSNIDQLLLIPMTIWAGLELTFIFAQFTQAFVSCAINPKYVGLIMIAFGLCDSIGSFAFGQLVKVVGRWPCFAIATLISYAMIIMMLVWRPLANQIVVLFVIAGLWGVADAVWQSQTSALYGVLFTEKNQPAFSNYRLWESGGFALFYILIPRIRTRTTLIILLVFLSSGIIGYALVEYRWKTNRKEQKNLNQ